MKQPTITVIIGGNTYSLCADDIESIRNLPDSDRQQLISLLKAVNQQVPLTTAPANKAADRADTSPDTTTGTLAGDAPDYESTKPERLGGGDVDALMAQLIHEEKSKQNPGLTRQTIYKFAIWFAVIVILLILVL